MTDFLLELRSEEIPARMQDKARDDLARLFTAELAKAGLVAVTITTYATPRRLALIAAGLPLETAAVSEELKGPKTSAPAQALDGFLRKTGLTADQLVDRDGTWFAVIDKPGRATADVLAEAIPSIIRTFPWPKSMRWGDASIATTSLRWVRPLQGIVALLGDEVVPCAVDGIVSGATTMGHRFHHSGPVTIGNAADYALKLRAAHVILDQDERRRIIRDGAQALATARGLTWISDQPLVIENSGLTEWPVPLLGDFDPAFLEVPPEVIQLTLATNQKYFVCEEGDGTLAPAFICTANIVAHDGGAAIIAGNRKVLAARLSDARFFWEQDKKVPLAEQAKKLARITFHEKLGSVADKVERVAKLAEWLATEGIVPGCDPALARQAALLCKADLVTEMVGEFPELQGIMGGYYARVEGLPDAVADAIRDHYKPVGQGDDVPTAPVTVAVSLADKLDTLFGFFAIGEAPTGSRDPFALRRAALGILSMLQANCIRLSVRAYLDAHLSTFVPVLGADAIPTIMRDIDSFRAADVDPRTVDMASLVSQRRSEVMPQSAIDTFVEGAIQIIPFLADRLKVQQREAGVRHDLIDAVFALGGEDDLVRLLARVHALQAFVGTEDGVNLLAGYKRAANILKKEGGADAVAAERSASTPQDAALIAALDHAEPTARAAITAEDFAGAMTALASLRAPIDAFFDGVMVNDPDPAIRAARLALLTRFRDAVHGVADFSKIEG